MVKVLEDWEGWPSRVGGITANQSRLLELFFSNNFSTLS
jgi:hypothetical protein